MLIRSALIALSCTALAVPAMAASAADAPRANIQFTDLDLSTNAGRATLERRIASAARTICAATLDTDSRAASARALRECRADVAAQAKSQVAAQVAARTPAIRL